MFQRVRNLLARGLNRRQATQFQGNNGTTSFQQEAWIRNTLREAKRKKEILIKPLHELEYIVVDTETTGFRPELGDEIISVAAVEMKGKEITSNMFSTYIKPEGEIPEFITELTGISKEDTEQAPTLYQALPSLLEFIGEKMIVGYYIGHDVTFLNHYLWQTYRLHINNRILEMKQVADLLYPNVDSHLLENVLNHLKIPVVNRHTSIGDVMMTAELWSRFISECQDQGWMNLNDMYSVLS